MKYITYLFISLCLLLNAKATGPWTPGLTQTGSTTTPLSGTVAACDGFIMGIADRTNGVDFYYANKFFPFIASHADFPELSPAAGMAATNTYFFISTTSSSGKIPSPELMIWQSLM